ncbi:MAG: PKD domain-containing protein [Nanoarchaeota archaeon]
MKRLLAMLLFFLILCELGVSLKTIKVNETDLVNLVPDSYDPDNDTLNYSFTEPLDKNGQWQTDYGDAGEYDINITVTDGELSASEDVMLIVEKKEAAPIIDYYLPKEDSSLDEGNSIDFEISANDPNHDEVSYIWYVDDEKAGDEQKFTYKPTYFDAGKHNVKAVASDGKMENVKEWDIDVNKVDRTKLLDNFKDIEIVETEKVSFELPDFEDYNLKYSISDPVGDDGVWETGYDDSGEYDVTIKIEDGKFVAEKKIKIIVNNKDRAPVFDSISNVKFKENQKADVRIGATDPDGDEITIYAENMPAGAIFSDNTFSWETSYDTVRKENILDTVLGKFHLLSRSFYVTFVAKSNDMETRKVVKIVVSDVNRAPTISLPEEIVINEGELLKIVADVSDPDGDAVKYTCSGWIETCEYNTNYGDEGVYVVKVTVTDDFLFDSKEVIIRVNNVNQEPTLIFKDGKVKEGDKIEISVNATDPDKDEIIITALNLPENASFENNIFSWVPGFDFTDDMSNATITFLASDNTTEVKKEMVIQVKNVNLGPQIINASPIGTFSTYPGKQIKFKIDATDFENDMLTYKWKFGLFEEYNATPVHLRTFTTPGYKKVTVVVSDDEKSAEYTWNVTVLAPEKKIVKKTAEPVVEKKVVVVEKPKVQEPVKESVEKITEEEPKQDYIYDRYSIIHNGKIVEEKAQKIIVKG